MRALKKVRQVSKFRNEIKDRIFPVRRPKPLIYRMSRTPSGPTIFIISQISPRIRLAGVPHVWLSQRRNPRCPLCLILLTRRGGICNLHAIERVVLK